MRHILFSLVLSVSAASFAVGCASTGEDSTEFSNEEVTAPGTFDVWQASDGQWHFHLVAGNHRILVTSEAYATRLGAINGVLSVTNNGVDPAQYRLVQGASGWLLHLVAANGEVIGHSETYYSKSNATRAIAACVRAVTTYLDKQVSATGARAQVDANGPDRFHFNLIAQNGEPILSGESYDSAAAAWNGVYSAQEAAAANGFSMATATDGSFYFTLRAANGQVVGVSEMYTSQAGAENGIASVQATFETIDLL